MNRKQFLGILGGSAALAYMKPLKALNKLSESLSASPKMPVLFLGHGSPMNAIEENEFTFGFQNIAKDIPKPQLILCVSAHWLTRGTWLTAMDNPKTINDFGGFPEALHKVQYPAKGAVDFAKELNKQNNTFGLDYDWGLDHGAWSVLIHLYPEANIPVVQLSIDYYQPASYHFELAQQLAKLREQGVLIVGSGNIVHNLRKLAFSDNVLYGHDWAIEASEKINDLILDGDFKSLLDYEKLGKSVQLAIPTPDHYYPLIYNLGLKRKNEQIELFNNKLVEGAISMTSLKIA